MVISVKRAVAALIGFTLVGGAAQAGVITYSDQTAFQNALTDGFTVIDTSANVGDTTEQLSIETAGAEFFGPSSYVRSDGLILNGQFFLGAATPSLGINFDGGVAGVGAWANAYDGGRIQIYSGLNGTGTLLGEVGYGSPSGVMFGGITSTDLIYSAIFTCDFNYDLACGLIDPTFGAVTVADTGGASEVPLPAALWLFIAGAGALGAAGRRKKT